MVGLVDGWCVERIGRCSSVMMIREACCIECLRETRVASFTAAASSCPTKVTVIGMDKCTAGSRSPAGSNFKPDFQKLVLRVNDCVVGASRRKQTGISKRMPAM